MSPCTTPTCPDVRSHLGDWVGPKFTIGGQRFTSHVDKNKRHEVKTSGRCFSATLFEIRPIDGPGVANAREFVFGISEK
jgi:hypothetical protein